VHGGFLGRICDSLTSQRQRLDPLPILQSLLLNGHHHPASRIFADSP